MKRNRITMEADGGEESGTLPCSKRVKIQQSPEESKKKEKENEEKEEKEKEKKNQEMHIRNPYRNNPPNYLELAKKYENFSKYVTEKGQIDYNDAMSNLQLTKVLLEEDFKIKYFDMPLDNLIPPVPQRLNYVLFVQDLMDCIPDYMLNNLSIHPSVIKFFGSETTKQNNTTNIYGLDIGCGASGILSLLLVQSNNPKQYNYKCIGTEVDLQSIECVNTIINQNQLQNKIKILQQTNSSHIFNSLFNDYNTNANKNDIIVHFTICNPPFFDDINETGLNPHRISSGTNHELVFSSGGEIGFIQLMCKECHTLKLEKNILWFTTMLGKKSSIQPIQHFLLQLYHNHPLQLKPFIIQTTFSQGKQTRWGLAWTFYRKCYDSYLQLLNNNDDNGNKNNVSFTHQLSIPLSSSINEQQWINYILLPAIQQYGIRISSSDLVNKQILFHQDFNLFSCNISWIVFSDQQQHILLTFKFLDGDYVLFSAFHKWLQSQLISN
ncbi:hypothetical protein RFI_09995 [Reticulomyxa filosa]|uniref:U6 small nuclear RNA (adenine-(43)-N(6))-methyltransferase n=1 Tax=Reticulomyxa filosa TaxID=46433 RepID=X6NM93_RETFI|nr:hypothetical protein RFI_09995 [Reticulomyxa filosa]|eukprot:ETO27136.1 hypothetical protein RFI_09995 [Reticulomyxa filosa]